MYIVNVVENEESITNLFCCTTSSFAKKKPVDFDDELKIGESRYDNMT